MSEKEKPFTVNDRRHFTPEGRAREEPMETPAASPHSPEPSNPQSPEPPPPAESPEASGQQPTGPARPSGPIDFLQFLLSLGAQAGMLLSPQVGDEGGAEALEGARQIIAILEMLQDKTQGRRTDEEDRTLEDLLFQLRLAYVERAKRS